jgi:AraC-like DNA-binding protein
MNPLTYHEEYSKKSFADLIRVFGDWKSDSIISLDETTGEGTIQVLDIEDGLQIRIWDCMFNSELNIHRKVSPNPGDKTFTLVYYLTPGTFVLENCSAAPGAITTLWNTVFMTSDSEFKVRILPNKPIRCLSLNFTPEWLQKNIFSDVDFHDHFFHQQLMDPKPFVMFESLTQIEERVISSLFQSQDQRSFGKLFFRSKALNVMIEFFLKIRGRISSLHGTTLYHEKQITEAERKLMQNLDKGLPDIRLIASELSISESTLKRYFKRVYGKNMYEYFLEKKMAQARKLLDERKNSVTEIAYMLGYEKVSQFINIFKRHYGIQPGAYRQSVEMTTAAAS